MLSGGLAPEGGGAVGLSAREKALKHKHPVRDGLLEHYTDLCQTTGWQHFVPKTFTSGTKDSDLFMFGI